MNYKSNSKSPRSQISNPSIHQAQRYNNFKRNYNFRQKECEYSRDILDRSYERALDYTIFGLDSTYFAQIPSKPTSKPTHIKNSIFSNNLTPTPTPTNTSPKVNLYSNYSKYTALPFSTDYKRHYYKFQTNQSNDFGIQSGSPRFYSRPPTFTANTATANRSRTTNSSQNYKINGQKQKSSKSTKISGINETSSTEISSIKHLNQQCPQNRPSRIEADEFNSSKTQTKSKPKSSTKSSQSHPSLNSSNTQKSDKPNGQIDGQNGNNQHSIENNSQPNKTKGESGTRISIDFEFDRIKKSDSINEMMDELHISELESTTNGSMFEEEEEEEFEANSVELLNRFSDEEGKASQIHSEVFSGSNKSNGLGGELNNEFKETVELDLEKSEDEDIEFKVNDDDLQVDKYSKSGNNKTEKSNRKSETSRMNNSINSNGIKNSINSNGIKSSINSNRMNNSINSNRTNNDNGNYNGDNEFEVEESLNEVENTEVELENDEEEDMNYTNNINNDDEAEEDISELLNEEEDTNIMNNKDEVKDATNELENDEEGINSLSHNSDKEEATNELENEEEGINSLSHNGDAEEATNELQNDEEDTNPIKNSKNEVEEATNEMENEEEGGTNLINSSSNKADEAEEVTNEIDFIEEEDEKDKDFINDDNDGENAVEEAADEIENTEVDIMNEEEDDEELNFIPANNNEEEELNFIPANNNEEEELNFIPANNNNEEEELNFIPANNNNEEEELNFLASTYHQEDEEDEFEEGENETRANLNDSIKKVTKISSSSQFTIEHSTTSLTENARPVHKSLSIEDGIEFNKHLNTVAQNLQAISSTIRTGSSSNSISEKVELTTTPNRTESFESKNQTVSQQKVDISVAHSASSEFAPVAFGNNGTEIDSEDCSFLSTDGIPKPKIGSPNVKNQNE